MARTFVQFIPTSDPWPTIDAWAAATKMAVVSYGPTGRLYKRGDGFWTSEDCVQIDAVGPALQLQVWAPFWLGGQELEVHTSTPLQYFPRRKARKVANDLLSRLGAPRIDSSATRLP